MAVTWEEASEITAGLVLTGKLSKNSVNPDYFLSPYNKLISDFKAGKEKDDLILSVGLNPVHTALESCKNLNGTGDADWTGILERTYNQYEAGVRLGKMSERLIRGEDVDWSKINYYSKLAQQNQGGDFTKLSQITETSVPFIKTGWKPIDDHLGGIPAVGLIIVGGLPGTGKTWEWIKISSEFAKYHTDKNVAFFSLEMTLPEINGRYNALNLPEEVKDRILVNPHPMRVEDIISKASSIENLGLVGIDFADLLIQGDTTESSMAHIYRTLMLGAKELNCPIKLYSQLRRNYDGSLPKPNQLRWCIPATERVYDIHKGWVTADKLNDFTCLSFNGNKLISAKAEAFTNTEQEILKITTKSGFVLRCSKNHPILHEKGEWIEAEKLELNSKIAVVKKTVLEQPMHYSPFKAKMLGYMIGDGYIPNKSKGGIAWCEPDDELISDFEVCFNKEFGKSTKFSKRRHSRDNMWVVTFPKFYYGNEPSEFSMWLDSLKMRGQNSYTFRIPQECFVWDDAAVSNLLAGLFASDGCVMNTGIKYFSMSKQLLLDIKLLLLRFGITARISKNDLTIKSLSDLIIFHEKIDIPGKKGRKLLQVIQERKTKKTSHDTSDVLPLYVTEQVRKFGYTKLSKTRRLTRQRYKKLVEEENLSLDKTAISLCSDDIWWDSIKSIEFDGYEMTYDITVPDHHNFVVEGIVTHNTGLAEALGWSIWMLHNPMIGWDSIGETTLPKQKQSAFILVWKMRGGFINHIDDSPGAIMLPFRPDKGWGDKSRWFSLQGEQ